MFGAQLVAFHALASLGAHRVEIQTMFSWDKLVRHIQVGAEFVSIARFAWIIAGHRDTAVEVASGVLSRRHHRLASNGD